MKKEILLELIEEYRTTGRKYFSLHKLKEDLFFRYPDFKPETLRKNISRFKDACIITSAGRGWYSFLQKKFVLNTEPVRNIVNLMKREFPLLDFNVWSTEQLTSYFHHIPTRFFVFIFADKYALQTIYEKLIIKGKKVFLNPSSSEAEKIFNIERETIVLRPSISQEPVDDHHSKIEKILVDLHIEKDNLAIADDWEYEIICENIVSRTIIQIDVFNYYISRRKLSATCPLHTILDKYCVGGTSKIEK